MKKFAMFLAPLLLSGCLLESVGPINRNIKPYGAHWVKEGMTRDGQLNDWVECGGDRSGSFSPSINKLLDKGNTGINREQVRKRLEDEADSCMVNRGYKFIRD